MTQSNTTPAITLTTIHWDSHASVPSLPHTKRRASSPTVESPCDGLKGVGGWKKIGSGKLVTWASRTVVDRGLTRSLTGKDWTGPPWSVRSGPWRTLSYWLLLITLRWNHPSWNRTDCDNSVGGLLTHTDRWSFFHWTPLVTELKLL